MITLGFNLTIYDSITSDVEELKSLTSSSLVEGTEPHETLPLITIFGPEEEDGSWWEDLILCLEQAGYLSGQVFVHRPQSDSLDFISKCSVVNQIITDSDVLIYWQPRNSPVNLFGCTQCLFAKKEEVRSSSPFPFAFFGIEDTELRDAKFRDVELRKTIASQGDIKVYDSMESLVTAIKEYRPKLFEGNGNSL